MGMIDSKQLLDKAIELTEHQAEFRDSLKESISNFADAAEEFRERAKDIDDEVLHRPVEIAANSRRSPLVGFLLQR